MLIGEGPGANEDAKGRPFIGQAGMFLVELLGQAGGPVRRPMLDLTDAEKAATRAAFESCGLKLPGAAAA